MSSPSGLVERVRACLASTENVTEKRMFGSQGFMVNGKLCVTARDTRIMCRIDPGEHDEAVKADGCEGVVMKGRVYRGYIHVSADAVCAEDALERWIARAIAWNAELTSREDA